MRLIIIFEGLFVGGLLDSWGDFVLLGGVFWGLNMVNLMELDWGLFRFLRLKYRNFLDLGPAD